MVSDMIQWNLSVVKTKRPTHLLCRCTLGLMIQGSFLCLLVMWAKLGLAVEGQSRRLPAGCWSVEIKHKHGGFNINYEKATVVWQQFGSGL
jgi:hypothetical protein